MTRRFMVHIFFGGGRTSKNCRLLLWKILPYLLFFGPFKALAFLELLGVAYLNVQRFFWRT